MNNSLLSKELTVFSECHCQSKTPFQANRFVMLMKSMTNFTIGFLLQEPNPGIAFEIIDEGQVVERV